MGSGGRPAYVSTCGRLRGGGRRGGGAGHEGVSMGTPLRGLLLAGPRRSGSTMPVMRYRRGGIFCRAALERCAPVARGGGDSWGPDRGHGHCAELGGRRGRGEIHRFPEGSRRDRGRTICGCLAQYVGVVNLRCRGLVWAGIAAQGVSRGSGGRTECPRCAGLASMCSPGHQLGRSSKCTVRRREPGRQRSISPRGCQAG